MSAGYQPQPTAPVPTGAHSIVLRAGRAPQLDDILGSFEATFGGYVPPDWTFDAECTQPGTDPEMFYPKRGGRRADDSVLKAICAVCVVREECLADALAFEAEKAGSDDVRPEVHGFRAGLTEKERRKMVQQMHAAEAAERKARALADWVAEPDTPAHVIGARHGISGSGLAKWAAKAGLEPRKRRGSK